MAWREALRDFYTRIAARLQSADARGAAGGWLAVHAAGRPCLLPLSQSGEIFPSSDLQPLPYTRPWFLGAANLRGEIHGVVDLAHFVASQEGLGMSRPGTESQAAGWFITLHPDLQARCALRVDRLEGMRPAADFGPALALHPSSNAPASHAWVSGFHVDGAGASWLALDLQALARAPEFLDAGA